MQLYTPDLALPPCLADLFSGSIFAFPLDPGLRRTRHRG